MSYTVADNKARINFIMEKELIKRLDEYSKHQCLSRSGAICSLITEILDQKQVINLMPQLTKLYELSMKDQKE
jgi:metal-responsive CopG/Arc/MetJ family transcriptional regulator